MATDTDPSGIEQRAVLRALVGATGIGLLLALATSWTHPLHSERAFSGWGLLFSGFVDTDAPVCGDASCHGTENLVVGSAPTAVVLLLALCLIAVCLTVTRLRCRVAIGLGVLAILGVLGETVTMAASVNKLGQGDHHVYGAGLIVTVLLAVLGVFVAGALSGRAPSRVRPAPIPR